MYLQHRQEKKIQLPGFRTLPSKEIVCRETGKMDAKSSVETGETGNLSEPLLQRIFGQCRKMQ
jgi:hypothetical protein